MILPQKNIFSKHQNKAEFKNLDDSEVLSNDFLGLRASAASLTSFYFMNPWEISICPSLSHIQLGHYQLVYVWPTLKKKLKEKHNLC